MKPAKLDATALHDDTLASSTPVSEACSYEVLACNPGIPEEYYVSEAVEDAPSYREHRDACTITGMLTFSCWGWGGGFSRQDWERSAAFVFYRLLWQPNRQKQFTGKVGLF